MSIKALVTIGLRSSLIIFDICCSYGRGGGIRSAPFGAITPPRLEFGGGLPSSRFCLPAPFPYLKQSLPSNRVGANCTLYSLLIPPFEIPPPDKKRCGSTHKISVHRTITFSKSHILWGFSKLPNPLSETYVFPVRILELYTFLSFSVSAVTQKPFIC